MERDAGRPSFEPQVTTLLLVMMMFVAVPLYAEEAKVFTNEDLAGHQPETVSVDEETMQKKEADIKEWEARKPEAYADDGEQPAIGKKARKKRARTAEAKAMNPSRPAKMAKAVSPGKMAGMSGAAKAANMAGPGRLAGTSGPCRK